MKLNVTEKVHVRDTLTSLRILMPVSILHFFKTEDISSFVGPLMPLGFFTIGDISLACVLSRWIPQVDSASGATPADFNGDHSDFNLLPVFSLTLARSPMASRSCRRASDFLNYSPGLASNILAEWKSMEIFFAHFLKIVSLNSHYTLGCQNLI